MIDPASALGPTYASLYSFSIIDKPVRDRYSSLHVKVRVQLSPDEVQQALAKTVMFLGSPLLQQLAACWSYNMPHLPPVSGR